MNDVKFTWTKAASVAALVSTVVSGGYVGVNKVVDWKIASYLPAYEVQLHSAELQRLNNTLSIVELEIRILSSKSTLTPSEDIRLEQLLRREQQLLDAVHALGNE